MATKETKQAYSPGLAGVIAGETQICWVDPNAGLMYRGYDIHEMAEKASFEEVAYLLLNGELPDLEELNKFTSEIARARMLPNAIDGMQGSYLGPEYGQDDVEKRLANLGARFATVPHDDMLDATAKALAEGQAVGWFQGRMEFGPRALGNRSILGDPRSPTMQKNLNLKVKYRESFRPFAPSVLREEVANWFDLDVDSPYMLLVAPVAQQHMLRMKPEEEQLFGIDKLNVVRSTIPAVTHVDYSARVQTVRRETNPTYYELISRFHQLTGCPVIINTSFNVRSEPIVCTPEDAFHCFMGTELDLLVAGDSILHKQEQDASLRRVYKDQFELD